MNKTTTADRGRTAQKRRRRGLAVLAAVLSTVVIGAVDTTEALEAEVSTDVSPRGRHVRASSHQVAGSTAAGGRMIIR